MNNWKIFLLIGIAMILTKNSYAGEMNFTGNFSTTAANANLWGVTANWTAILVSDETDDVIYTYTHAGVAINSFADGSAAGTALRGITTNGVNIWDVKYSNPAAVTVSKLTMSGAFVSSFSGNAANIDALGICTDGVLLYVADLGDNRVYKYTLGGTFQGSWVTTGMGATSAAGVACSNTSNAIYVGDSNTATVFKYAKNNGTTNGSFVTRGKGSIGKGLGMDFNSSRIYIGNANTDVIHIFNGTNATIISDTTPPVISSLTNTTTTNQSVYITWTTNENADGNNLSMGLCPSFSGTHYSSNLTLSLNHALFIGGLSNRTNYCFNATSQDASSNKANANFSFYTAFNQVTNTCSCPFITPILCSDNCLIDTECNNQGNNFQVTGDTGGLTMTSRVYNIGTDNWIRGCPTHCVGNCIQR